LRAVAPIRFLSLPVLAALCGCDSTIDLGSQILWSAHHEDGDLSEWMENGGGGWAADPPVTTVAATSEVARGGSYAVKLTNAAVDDYDTSRVWRQAAYPAQAYYSAWYYLPQAYTTTAGWTIMQFRAPSAQDPSVLSYLLDVDLRSLPGGEMILSIFDHRAPYLRSPTPPAVLPVPIGRWFQVEALYRNVADDGGHFSLWLDGQLNYDFARPFGVNTTVYWSPCSSSYDLTPADAALYVDDAAISLVRLTPEGVF
jgi:hypothetical protein